MTSLMSRPGPAGDPDEETIALERKLFRKRRRWVRLGRVRSWIAVLLVVVLLAAGAYVVWFSPFLAAEQVSVAGTDVLAPVEVREAAAVPIGQPLARLDLDAVRGRVGALPEVKSVRVTRAWPHGVVDHGDRAGRGRRRTPERRLPRSRALTACCSAATTPAHPGCR